MKELNEKTVVVTGAASGIGAEVVALTAGAGARVTGLDIDGDRGRQVAQKHGAGFHECDVSDAASWEMLADHFSQDSAGIDYLHLNAGIQIAPPEADLDEYRFTAMTVPRYRRLMGVNVDGVVLGLHFLLPHMNQGGAVVVTGSLAGIVPYEVDPLYAMTKHAVTGLVRSLKNELRERDVRINALCPAGIQTAIIPHAQRTADAGFMSPEHVAGEVIKLFFTEESGATWSKVDEDHPARITWPPGRSRERTDWG